MTELSQGIHEVFKDIDDVHFAQRPEQLGPQPPVENSTSYRFDRRRLGTRNQEDPGRNAWVRETSKHDIHLPLDNLLWEVGFAIWGEDVPPREGCTYRLVLEDDVDRPKIEALLHLWV